MKLFFTKEMKRISTQEKTLQARKIRNIGSDLMSEDEK